MMQQKPGNSGRPPSQLKWRLANRFGHGLGIVGVIMSAAAILTGFDPGRWIHLFPWDATGVGQATTGLIGPGMVLVAQKLVSTGPLRPGRKKKPRG